ncbi:MAG: hypothetical protein Q8J64_00710 [Thermodesulfovibrionales bacterium]|nr:hypothetical protein [Thermodesulfovibrionales bacterium]
MLKNLKMFLIFLSTLAALTLALKLLSWLPLNVQKGTLRSYGAIEDVSAELRPAKIFLPSYFPQYLKWPPSEIYAQKGSVTPPASILMHFTNQNTGEIVLATSQGGAGTPELKSKIEPVRIIKEEDVLIKGRSARLYLAICADGKPCNKVGWQEDGYLIAVTLKDSAAEALRIAESMLSD